MAPLPGPLSLHRVVMMIVMVSVNDYDLFGAGAMPAGLALAHLYLRADSIAAAAHLSTRLATRRIALDLATGGRGLFRLHLWSGVRNILRK
jgi:hypothetical protein